MTTKQIPLARPNITQAEIDAVVAVLRSADLCLGPKLPAFERAFADHCGTKHAVACSNGTCGLHLLIRAMEISNGDAQLLKNVRVSGGAPLEDAQVRAAIAEGETALGDGGRLLIRKSGTEPVIRVMAEGVDEALVGRVVEDIVETIEQATRAAQFALRGEGK